ncbi:hypothetical protein XFF6994_2290011 [Xanthomonas citri pv. fuscans]|nr:hypothetical protein XFF6994_2290011 [Xanthomonas citri pv. fuscans]
MPAPALQSACRWVHVSTDSALMHYNFGSVAHVTPGQIWLCWRGCTIKASHRGSLQQGMRFAERWIATRTGLPIVRKARRITPDDKLRWPGSIYSLALPQITLRKPAADISGGGAW